jgi:hypothetical protein
MRFPIKITVNVNPTMWNAEYGTDDDKAAIAEQVRAVAQDAVEATFRHLAAVTVLDVRARS